MGVWLRRLSAVFGYFSGEPDHQREFRKLHRDMVPRGRDFDFSRVDARFRDADSWDEREWALDGLNPYERSYPEFFQAWVDAEPDNQRAHLLWGSHAVNWAWEARTGARAEEVADSSWPTFFKRLQLGQHHLATASEMDPDDHLAYTQLIRCGMGLQLGETAARGFFERAVEACPESWAAHSAFLWQICKKWGGSHDAMFEFARQAFANQPEGSGLGALIAACHSERYLYALAFDAGEEELAEVYWEQPEVQEELVEVYRRSVGSPKHVETKASFFQRNFFCYALSMAGLKHEAREVFTSIGKRYSRWPWQIYGEPGLLFMEQRNKIAN